MRKIMAMAAAGVLAACNSGAAGQLSGENAVHELSGERAERAFELAGFDGVAIEGPDNVEISVGEDFSLRAEGDTAILDELEIEVSDGELVVRRKGDHWFGNSVGGRATVYVTMPTLRAASVAGSGTMTVDRAEADRFEASIAGSGNLIIAALSASDAEFDIAGSGDMRIAGSVSDVEIGIAGSGNMEFGDLQTERMEISIAGSGDVEAFATGEVEANLIGSGDVSVRGGARCRSNSLGSGDLRCS